MDARHNYDAFSRSGGTLFWPRDPKISLLFGITSGFSRRNEDFRSEPGELLRVCATSAFSKIMQDKWQELYYFREEHTHSSIAERESELGGVLLQLLECHTDFTKVVR